MEGKILVTETVSVAGIHFLQEKGYTVIHSQKTDEESLIRDLKDCAGMIVRIVPITKKVIGNAPNLKVIAKHGVGTDNIDITAAKTKGIRVINTPRANTLSVAEYTVALLLSCARNIPLMSQKYRDGEHDTKDRVECHQVSGNVLGLLGLGHIGQIVARIASAGLGMKVLAYDPYIKTAPEGVTLVDDMDKLLSESDYVSVHMPLTPHTRHCVSTHQFSVMKKTAYIINCSRGSIIDEAELIAALKSGEIGGAALDVTESEPALPDNPLFKMDNVILTAHNAATTKEAMDNMVLDAASGIDDVLNGRTPKWEVA
ncbi:MAG: hydroxyacid dehydrogenase [Synergistaceae bacterium]